MKSCPFQKSRQKFLQEMSQKKTDNTAGLERNQHRLEQYSRQECLDFSGISNAVLLKELESSVIYALKEIGIKLSKS